MKDNTLTSTEVHTDTDTTTAQAEATIYRPKQSTAVNWSAYIGAVKALLSGDPDPGESAAMGDYREFYFPLREAFDGDGVEAVKRTLALARYEDTRAALAGDPEAQLRNAFKRLARRVPLGIARVGGVGANGSGDIFIAFSTANPGAAQRTGISGLEMLPNDRMTPLFEATVYATEEAIVNALVAAETMRGIDGNTVYALPHDRLKQVLGKYNRLN